MTFNGLSAQEKKMAREMLEELSKIDLRSPKERVEQLLKKFRKEGEITGFLPRASYKKLHGLLVIIAKKAKYDVSLINIDGKQKTDEELEGELRKFLNKSKES